jgi:hypothetical protein
VTDIAGPGALGSPVKRKPIRYIVEVETPDGFDQWYLGTSRWHVAHCESRARITTLRHLRFWLNREAAQAAADKWRHERTCVVREVEVDPDWTWEKGAF